MISVTLVISVLLGCSHATFVPVREQDRVPVLMIVRDVTGGASDSLLSACLENALDSQLLYAIRLEHHGWGSKHWVLTIGPNPFRAAFAGETPRVRGTVDLERIDYGPAESMMDVLTGFAVLGLLGAALSQSDPNTFAAAIQCRALFTEPASLGSVLARVANTADVRRISRVDQMARVCRDAANSLLLDLATIASKEKLARFEPKALEYGSYWYTRAALERFLNDARNSEVIRDR